MILNYFKLNMRDETVRQYLYTGIPRYYVFKKQKINGNDVLQWIKRKKHFSCIGRMYSVNPSQVELYGS
jgi:hypothetical protein